MTENITRNEIAENLFKEIGLSKAECLKFVDIIIESFIQGIIDDKKLKIPNFGTFHLRFKNTREGRNPKTKELAIISSRNVVLFKVSEQLKDRLNKV